jgi:hypothetical protein
MLLILCWDIVVACQIWSCPLIGNIMPLFSSTILDRSAASCLVALNKTYLLSFGCLVVLRCGPVQFWMFVCDSGKWLIHLPLVVLSDTAEVWLLMVLPFLFFHLTLSHNRNLGYLIFFCTITLCWHGLPKLCSLYVIMYPGIIYVCHSRGVFHLNCWAHRFMLRVTVAFRISHTDDTNAISYVKSLDLTWGCCVLRNDLWNICPYLGKLGLNPVSGPLSYVCVYGLYQHSELLELYGWAKRFRLSYDIVDIFWLPCMIWLPSWVCRVTVACTQVLLMLLTYCSVALVDCAIVFSM